jgi:GH24 family phage-related lysozyme (muramidase)
LDIKPLNIKAIQQLLTKHEGVRPRKYKDIFGNVSAGIGCNLDAPGCEAMLKAVLPHIKFSDLYNGLIALSSEDIQSLLDYQTAVAIDDARKLFASFDAQPDQVQQCLVDMSFNLGYPKLRHFVKFIAAVESEHYAEAIAQLVNTAWRHEVASRATDDIALLAEVANYRTFQPEVPPSAPA